MNVTFVTYSRSIHRFGEFGILSSGEKKYFYYICITKVLKRVLSLSCTHSKLCKWLVYLNNFLSVSKDSGRFDLSTVSIQSHRIVCKSGGGGALCVELGFYADISWKSRCKFEINVGAHFCKIFLVFEVNPESKGCLEKVKTATKSWQRMPKTSFYVHALMEPFL